MLFFYLCAGHLLQAARGTDNQEHKTFHKGFRLSSLAFRFIQTALFTFLAAWSNDDHFAAGTLPRSTAIAVRTPARTGTGLSDGIYQEGAVSYRVKKCVEHQRLIS